MRRPGPGFCGGSVAWEGVFGQRGCVVTWEGRITWEGLLHVGWGVSRGMCGVTLKEVV